MKVRTHNKLHRTHDLQLFLVFSLKPKLVYYAGKPTVWPGEAVFQVTSLMLYMC